MIQPLESYVLENRACPHCNAGLGEPCVIASGPREGKKAQWTHEARYDDARHIWSLGYEAGEQDGQAWEHRAHAEKRSCPTELRQRRAAA